jgi:outer membrane autotransporter protein
VGFGPPAYRGGLTLNFAASTARLAAFEAMDSLIREPVDQSGLNFWIDGSATLHARTGSEGEQWGSFALLSAGADMLVSDALLVGLALHADRMEDRNAIDQIHGYGLLAGPYLSAELGKGVFLDASLLYGQSWNEALSSIFSGNFGTERLLAKGSLEGEWTLSDTLTFRPLARLFYLREGVASYRLGDGAGASAMVSGFVIEQLRLSGGGSLHFLLTRGRADRAALCGTATGPVRDQWAAGGVCHAVGRCRPRRIGAMVAWPVRQCRTGQRGLPIDRSARPAGP